MTIFCRVGLWITYILNLCECECVYMCLFVLICLCSTVKLVQVEKFLVQNATTDTVQARWASVKGATGYRLTWESSGKWKLVMVMKKGRQEDLVTKSK